jgi:anti-sigma B factor antagonist
MIGRYSSDAPPFVKGVGLPFAQGVRMSAADYRTESTRLALTSSVTSSGVICLTVAGEIDIGTVNHLRDRVMQVVREPGVTTLLLDFGPLRFLDSSGIAALITAHRAAQEQGVSFAITNCQGTVRHVLEVTGVYEVLATDGRA